MKRSVLEISVLLAGGVVAATLASMALAQAGWMVMAGPLLMVLTLLGAALRSKRYLGTSRKVLGLALVAGAALVVATAIVAAARPASVPALMPVLCSGAAYPILASLSGEARGQDSQPSGH